MDISSRNGIRRKVVALIALTALFGLLAVCCLAEGVAKGELQFTASPSTTKPGYANPVTFSISGAGNAKRALLVCDQFESSGGESYDLVDGKGTIKWALHEPGAHVVSLMLIDENEQMREYVKDVTVMVSAADKLAKPVFTHPEGTQVDVMQGEELTLKWTKPDGATGYFGWVDSLYSASLFHPNENSMPIGFALDQPGSYKVHVCARGMNSAQSDFAELTVNVVKGTKPVKGVKLNMDKVTLEPGEFAGLVATVLPADAADKRVTYSTSDASVATVEDFGWVEAIAEGTARITVTTVDGGFKAHCDITVGKRAPGPQDVSFTYDSDRFFVGKKYTPTVTFTPEGEFPLTWKSSKPKIAKVNAAGVLNPVKKGTATITATTQNGLTYSRDVTVLPNKIAAVTLDVESTITLRVADRQLVNVTLEPAELAPDAKVTAASSKKKIAAIVEPKFGPEGNSFTIEALKAGKSVITVKVGKVKTKLTVNVTN